MDKSIRFYTDVAAFLFFHPDDLENHSQDPIAWYMQDFRYGPASRAGKIFGFCCSGDMTADFRLTRGELTARESAAACAGAAFYYHCRHGRVYLDNSDALPGQEKMEEADDAGRWFDLPLGEYRVQITPMQWETEADYQQGPDFVVQFLPWAEEGAPILADTPMELRQRKDFAPEPAQSAVIPLQGTLARAPEIEFAPWLVQDQEQLRYHENHRVELTLPKEPWRDILFSDDRDQNILFVAQRFGDVDLGVMVEPYSIAGGRAMKVSGRILAVATVAEAENAGPAPAVTRWSVYHQHAAQALDLSEVKGTIQAAIAADPDHFSELLSPLGESLDYSQARLASLEDSFSVLSWLARLLPLNLKDICEFTLVSDAGRWQLLKKHLPGAQL